MYDMFFKKKGWVSSFYHMSIKNDFSTSHVYFATIYKYVFDHYSF